MSRFTVCRSWSGYCLLLDDDRIAGGKPDYHEGNVIYEWRTRDTYGPVDELKAENAKLRELVKDMLDVMLDYRCDIRMPNSLDYSNEPAVFKERARELGIEVDA